MKIFLRIVGVIVTLVVAFLLIWFLLPQTIVIERSVVTSAAPETIYPLIADLKRWPDWQAWNKEMDPTVTYTFSEPSAGEGASYEWKGEELSTGRVVLTGVGPNSFVDYTVDFADTGANSGKMTFQSVGKDPRTHIVWTFQCDMGFSPIGRYIGLMMRGTLEKDFDTGLANLKKLAETEPRASVPAKPAATGDSDTTAAAASATEGLKSAGDAPATDPASADAEARDKSSPDAASPDAAADVPAASDGASTEAPAAPN
jgi:hypothetical protein